MKDDDNNDDMNDDDNISVLDLAHSLGVAGHRASLPCELRPPAPAEQVIILFPASHSTSGSAEQVYLVSSVMYLIINY